MLITKHVQLVIKFGILLILKKCNVPMKHFVLMLKIIHLLLIIVNNVYQIVVKMFGMNKVMSNNVQNQLNVT